MATARLVGKGVVLQDADGKAAYEYSKDSCKVPNLQVADGTVVTSVLTDLSVADDHSLPTTKAVVDYISAIPAPGGVPVPLTLASTTTPQLVIQYDPTHKVNFKMVGTAERALKIDGANEVNLDILTRTKQLFVRNTADGNKYTEVSTDSSGFLNVIPTGNQSKFTGDLKTVGTIYAANTGDDSLVSSISTSADGDMAIQAPSGKITITSEALQPVEIAGQLLAKDTTQSTSSVTGGVVAAGGVGIAKNVNIAGTAHIYDTTQSTSAVTGSLILDGGLGVAKNAYISGVGHISNTTQATSKTTGALIVDGGLGVSKDIWCTNLHATGIMYGGITIRQSLPIYAGWVNTATYTPAIETYEGDLHIFQMNHAAKHAVMCTITMPANYVTGTEIWITVKTSSSTMVTPQKVYKMSAYMSTAASNSVISRTGTQSPNGLISIAGASVTADVLLESNIGPWTGVGVNPGDLLSFVIYRDGNNPNDTYTGYCCLHDVLLYVV